MYIVFVFFPLSKPTNPNCVVHPIKQRPVKIVAVVLIPSAQIIFKVTRESWAMNK